MSFVRRFARVNAEVFGSLRILAEAKERGFLTEVKPVIEALLTSGYWVDSESLLRSFLWEVGEGSA